METSFSSKLITETTLKRNPHGEEANWIQDGKKFNTWTSRKELLKAEGGYALAALISVVETAACATLCLLALPLALVNKEPLKKSFQWLQSSSFSVIWSVAYLAVNFLFPHLLTHEDYARNHIFRGDYQNDESWPSAPLASRLFMMVREMPEFLATAHALMFPDLQEEEGRFARVVGKTRRYYEILTIKRRRGYAFRANAGRLSAHFKRINEEMATKDRPICAYFVSGKDTNGMILSDIVVAYHHYKINKFQKHFDVSAKVVQNTAEMFAHLRWLKETYPDRPIKVVDIVAHGNSDQILIPCEERDTYRLTDVKEDEFSPCAPDADIIIDACSTGTGRESIAREIAYKNRGKRVFAPATPLYFSRPRFKRGQECVTVDHVTHGFAIVNANTSRQFHFPQD